MTENKKTYVLDTSVLLSSPKALFAFEEHDVVLPLVVLKELESKRHDPELGLPARTALRLLEKVRTSSKGDLKRGVSINDIGGTIRVEVNHIDQSGLPDGLRMDRTHDTRILAVAKGLHNEGQAVVLVSKDLPMRLLAETVGVPAQEYLNEQTGKATDEYNGIETFDVPSDIIDGLFNGEEYSSEILAQFTDKPEVLHPNTGLRLKSPNSSGIGRITPDGEIKLIQSNRKVGGVSGRSAEQKIALEHLMDPDVGIVSLGGPAGTGKTLMALAAGVEQVLESSIYDKVIVFRPLFAVGGQDLGFLPGTEEEKMAPWAGAVFDAMAAISPTGETTKMMMDSKKLEILPLTHIRGRSLHNAFVVIDEAQNLERQVLLTALSRMGEQSKVVLSWDAAQRDNLRVGRHDGIAAVVDKLIGQPLFSHTSFVRSERGPIAALATSLLDDEM